MWELNQLKGEGYKGDEGYGEGTRGGYKGSGRGKVGKKQGVWINTGKTIKSPRKSTDQTLKTTQNKNIRQLDHNLTQNQTRRIPTQPLHTETQAPETPSRTDPNPQVIEENPAKDRNPQQWETLNRSVA